MTSSFFTDAETKMGETKMDNILIFIISPRLLNLVYFDINWKTKCKRLPINIEYIEWIRINGIGTIYAILMAS